MPSAVQKLRKPMAGSLRTFVTDGQTDRQTDGRTDGQTDRRTDRRTAEHFSPSKGLLVPAGTFHGAFLGLFVLFGTFQGLFGDLKNSPKFGT